MEIIGFAAGVILLVIIFCAGSSSSGKSDETKNPEYMELRSHADGSCDVYNWKTEDVIGTFPTRSEASRFLEDLKSRQ